jgi:hypothetical protein
VALDAVGVPESPPDEPPPQDARVKRTQLVKKNLTKKLVFIAGTIGKGIIAQMVTSIRTRE